MIFKPGKVMQSDIPTTTIIGIIPSEEIEQRTGGRSQNVARTRCKEFQPRSIRAHANHPSSSMLKSFWNRKLRPTRTFVSKVSWPDLAA